MLFALIIGAFVAAIALGLIGYFYVKLFARSGNWMRAVMVLPLIVFATWWLPMGDVHGTWRIQYGLSVTTANSRGAPSQMQFLECGTGTRMDIYGNATNFAWNITECEKLELCTSIENYKVRIYGFGTRMRLETNGHQATRSFTATYRKSIFN